MSQLYDCHTHVTCLEDLAFYYERGIVPCINLSSRAEYEQVLAWKAQLDRKYPNSISIHFSVGIHPWRADRVGEDFREDYECLLAQADCIGEIGLDSVWTDVPLAVQEGAFVTTLQLAHQLQKPVILHTKGQEGRICQILQGYQVLVMVHWYVCPDYVQDYLDLGAYFTIGPAVLTDPVVQDLVRQVPLNRLLLETDGREALEWLVDRSLSPAELEDLISQTLGAIAELKDLPLSTVQTQLAHNAQLFFKKI